MSENENNQFLNQFDVVDLVPTGNLGGSHRPRVMVDGYPHWINQLQIYHQIQRFVKKNLIGSTNEELEKILLTTDGDSKEVKKEALTMLLIREYTRAVKNIEAIERNSK